MTQQGVSPAEISETINALQWPTFYDTYHMSGPPPLTITYSFGTGRPSDLRPGYWTDVSDWGSYSAAEMQAVRAALTEYEKYINVTFVETTTEGTVDFTFLKAAQGVSGGRGGFQYNTLPDFEYDGFILFNTNRDMSQANQTDLILHEIGHALSLKHPGNYDVNPQNAPPGPYLPAETDNEKFTVMSYSPNPELALEVDRLMLYDIAALQERWGANGTHMSGDDSYSARTDGRLYVIWDGGGNDRLETGAAAGNSILDLRQGRFSNLDGADRIAVAYGTVLEAAVAGAGDDALYGNFTANRLFGAGGHDRLFGSDGFDTLHGGNGNDTVFGGNGRDVAFLGTGNDLFNDNSQGGDLGRDNVFAGAGNDTIQGGGGDDTLRGELDDDLIFARQGNDRAYGGAGDDRLFGGDGFDTLEGGDGKDVVFGGNGRDLVFLGKGDDVFGDNGQGGVLGQDTVFAGAGNDTIQGGAGNDVFRGEWGDDLIFGRLGDDTLNGGAGNDTMDGGAGADTFVFAAGFGVDRINGYAKGSDALQFDDALWTGTLSAVQVVNRFASLIRGNVVFDFGADEVTLFGVSSLAGLESDLAIV